MYVINLVEFLLDSSMLSQSRSQAFRTHLHSVITSSFVPFELSTAMDGAYATWRGFDSTMLQILPICSHAEMFNDGKCRSCPTDRFGLGPNSDKCYKCGLLAPTMSSNDEE